MATKALELSNPNSCLSKAAPHEPIFVLRAHDETAAQMIRHWAAVNDGMQPPEKVNEALSIAAQFDQWHAENNAPKPMSALGTIGGQCNVATPPSYRR
jgi:hypothetical protein